MTEKEKQLEEIYIKVKGYQFPKDWGTRVFLHTGKFKFGQSGYGDDYYITCSFEQYEKLKAQQQEFFREAVNNVNWAIKQIKKEEREQGKAEERKRLLDELEEGFDCDGDVGIIIADWIEKKRKEAKE